MTATRWLDRRFLFDILERGRHFDWRARLVDRLLILAVAANALVIVLETIPDLRLRHARLFGLSEVAVTLVFVAEYVFRLWVADLHPQLEPLGRLKARVAYATSPMQLVDLAVVVLPLVATAFGSVFGTGHDELVVSLRLVRLLKLIRFSPALRSLFTAIASEAPAICASLFILGGFALAASAVMVAVEGEAQPDRFGSIPEALYWAVATLTTIGYGDVVPTTTEGKMINVLIMIVGPVLYALPLGIIAAAFTREVRQRDFVITWSMVASVPLLSQLEPAEIADVIRLLRAQATQRGTFITRAAEPAIAMYFILSGRVDVYGGSRPMRLGPGDFFGESAMAGHADKAKDAVAVTEVRLLVLESDDLHRLMRRKPSIGRHIREVAAARISLRAPPGGRPTPQKKSIR